MAKAKTGDYPRLYRQMVRIRTFEDGANKLYPSARTPGVAPGIDQRAGRQTHRRAGRSPAARKGTMRNLGEVPEGRGYSHPPTVLLNVPDTADCIHGAIFGTLTR